MPDLVEALYNYQPQSPDDMQLEAGQRVEVLEHLSADWARGKNLSTGKTGVFPKNYVKLVQDNQRDEKFSRPAAPMPPNATGSSANSHSSGQPQGFDEKQQYQPPAASWQQSQPPPQYQPPQQYQAPQQYQQYQPPQQAQQFPPQQQQQQQAQPQGRRHGQFGNLARRFGDSVVFGAGATLGSDIINKIF